MRCLVGSRLKYAQSKIGDQNASYLAKQSKLRSKNLIKIFLKNIQKALKQPLQHANFKTFLWEPAPSESLSCFSISFKSVLPKICLKQMWKLCPPPPFRISRYATASRISFNRVVLAGHSTIAYLISALTYIIKVLCMCLRGRGHPAATPMVYNTVAQIKLLLFCFYNNEIRTGLNYDV